MLGRLQMPIQQCLNEFRVVLGTMYSSPRSTSVKSTLAQPQPKYDHEPMEKYFKDLVRRNDVHPVDRQQDGFFESDPIQCQT